MDEKKGIAKIAKYFVNFQYGLSIVMALLLLAMIGYEVVMRYVFKSSLMGVEEVMVFPIIWLYMLGGANASYEKSHIECGILTLYIKKEHSMLIFNLVKRIICVVILAWITYWSFYYFYYSLTTWKVADITYAPLFFANLAMTVGFVLMLIYAIRDVIQVTKDLKAYNKKVEGRRRCSGYDGKCFAYYFTGCNTSCIFAYDEYSSSGMFLGSADVLKCIWKCIHETMLVWVSSQSTGTVLLASPLFILPNVYGGSGIAKRLLDCADSFIGHIKSGLGTVAIVVCAVMGAISGSGFTGVAATGPIMIPRMEEQGYERGYATALVTVSSVLGLLIPPSNVMITYSLVSGGTSVAALFMAGYIPGILWGLACMLVVYVIAKKKGYRAKKRFTAF